MTLRPTSRLPLHRHHSSLARFCESADHYKAKDNFFTLIQENPHDEYLALVLRQRSMSQETGPELEGVTQYQLDFKNAQPPDWSLCSELNAWRRVLFLLNLTGEDRNRYGGLAYGNVSRRISADRFLISGTQTGGLPHLSSKHYSRVNHCDVSRNLILAEGTIPPSSEALTHGAAYLASSTIKCVLHVHSPEVWTNADSLGIAITDPTVTYGTPTMAASVAALLRDNPFQVIAMGGHKDGILSCGPSPESAAQRLIHMLARAIKLASTRNCME